MKIFSFLHSGQRTPDWTYEAGGHIWRILFSEKGRIVGESRDHEKKTASFFCLDEETGHVCWEDVHLREPWWVGIEAVYRDFLILHEFLKPDLPEHQRIRVLDIESGALRWKNDDLSFSFAHDNRLYAYRDLFEKRVGYALDLGTGEVVEAYEEGLKELRTLKTLAANEQLDERFRFPEAFEVETADPEIEKLVRKETKGESVEGRIEVIRERDLLFIGYYVLRSNTTPEATALKNHFAVYRVSAGRRIFSDVLTTDARRPTPDSFFIRNQTTYFIKDQRILTALRLWKSSQNS